MAKQDVIEWRDGNLEYDRNEKRTSVEVVRPFLVAGKMLSAGTVVTNTPTSELRSLEARGLAKEV